MSDHYDAVIVGSGFGGSICALRLAQAGRSVLVLERGRRYRPADFPRDPRRVNDLLWRFPGVGKSTGLYDLRFLSGIGVVVASGVGGGSLIYAGVHIRPDAEVFATWPAGIRRTDLEPYFDRVATALDLAPLPSGLGLRKRDAFRAAAELTGRRVFDPPMAIAWSPPPGSPSQPCALIAECEFGCPKGAKKTVDVMYLHEAETLGAAVVTGALASHIEAARGGFRVHYREVATGREMAVTGGRVVLAAGTLGTNELLLRSRDLFRTLPALSPRLGFGFSGNGDFIGTVHDCTVDVDPWNGPDVTSVMRYDEPPQFTLAAPTFAAAVMRVIARASAPPPSWLRTARGWLWPRLGTAIALALRFRLWRFLPQVSATAPRRTTNLFAIGRDSAGGRVVLRGGRLDVVWKYGQENQHLVRRMIAAMEATARVYGGRYVPAPTWTMFERILSVHPLGGCALSRDRESGVVSVDGEIHGYPGLFVADGSVVPTALGFHPAMTIAALAERTAECVVRSYSQ